MAIRINENFEPDFKRRFHESLLRNMERHFWQPLIKSSSTEPIKQTSMKSIKVLPPKENEEFIPSNEASFNKCYLWDSKENTIGVPVLKNTSSSCSPFSGLVFFIQWSNGGNSQTYKSFSSLVKSITEYSPHISIHQLTEK